MIPSRLTITATIWCLWENKAAGLFKPMRRVLHNVTWSEESITTAIQTGIVMQNPAVITIFTETSGLTYKLPHEWLNLSESELDGFWTCDLTQSARPIIAPFESDKEFPFATMSGATGITNLLNNFRRDTPGIRQISDINDNRRGYGSHLLIQAG